LKLSALRASNLSFQTVVDSAMLHILGDRERDLFIDGLGDVVRSGGLYRILGDARRSPSDIYGITPSEIRNQFGEADGWEVVVAYSTLFERRWSSNSVYFIGVQRM
jgi:hypothetical protein